MIFNGLLYVVLNYQSFVVHSKVGELEGDTNLWLFIKVHRLLLGLLDIVPFGFLIDDQLFLMSQNERDEVLLRIVQQ